MDEPATCPSCNGELPSGARFCPACGSAVGPARRREERRLVTVLFADLAGVDQMSRRNDPEPVKELLDACFDRFVPVIEAYGGHVDKIVDDEIMAIFGAPVGHEDDAERAVRAGLALHVELASTGSTLGLRVGINSGEALAGTVAPSGGYTVTGDVVNTARRLCDLAEVGRVLVGERTVIATSDVVEYRAPEDLALRGRMETVTAHEAIGIRGTDGTSPEPDAQRIPFIGRSKELSDLRRASDEAAGARRSAVHVIVGAPGVGKTRLADELARSVADGERPIRVLRTTVPAYDGDADLAPLADLVAAALDLPAAADPAVRRRLLSEGLERLGSEARLEAPAARLEELLGLAPHRLGGPIDVEPRTGSPAPGEQQMAAAAGVLGAMAIEPTLLVVDDLHRAGDRLLRFLLRLAERFADRPLFILGLARDDLLERHARQLGAGRITTSLLEPLALPEASDLVLAILADAGRPEAAIGPESLERLVSLTAGSPLLAEQLIRFLVESGRLREVGDRWLWDADEAEGTTPLPDGIRSLTGARLDALPADERGLIDDAAVIGRTFWRAALIDLGGRSDADVDILIARLSGRGLVLAVPDEGRGDLAFDHALTREVAYGSLPRGDRSGRHAAVAAWLERSVPAVSEPVAVSLVAHHHERAVALARSVGIPDRDLVEPAFAALVSAAREESRREGLRRAERWYRRARDVGTADADASIEATAEHGGILLEIGCLEEARETFEELARRAGRTRPPMAAFAEANLGAIARLTGDTDLARERFDAAASAWRALEDPQGVADTSRLEGWAEMIAGRPRAALQRLEHAASVEEQIDEPVGHGDTLRYLGWCEMLVGRPADALRHLEGSAEILATADDAGALGWALGLIGHTHLRQGRPGRAREIAGELRQMASQEGDAWAEWTCATLEAAALVSMGDAAGGRRLVDLALRRFEELDAPWELGMARMVAGQAAAVMGDMAEARILLSGAIDARRRTPGSLGEDTLAMAELARVELADGDVDAAERRAKAALAVTRAGVGDAEGGLRSLLVLAEVACGRGDEAEAEMLLEDAVGSRRPRDGTEAWAVASLRLADRRLEGGDVEGASALVRPVEGLDLDARSVAEPLAAIISRLPPHSEPR